MVQLLDADIKTREVLDWRGIHLIHYMGSSCSQKVRIFLNLKGIDWESHTIDLLANENVEPWFLDINPRGLAPVLVHDGAVHIESNDIIQYLEKIFPEPRLIPVGHEKEVAALLKHEDDLHLDLRTLSFRFVFNPPGPPKTSEQLKKYRTNGTGTVRGQKDGDRDIQLEWWERAAKEGYTDERTRAAAHRFHSEFEALENTLAQRRYLLGQDLTVLDIAWFIYAHRLSLSPAIRSQDYIRGSMLSSESFAQGRNSRKRLLHRQSSMPTSRQRARLKQTQANPSRWWPGSSWRPSSNAC